MIYGSNAMHGVVDVSSVEPSDDGYVSGGLELGTDDFYRGRLELSSQSLAFSGNYTDSRSFREDERYRHALANGTWSTQVGTTQVRTQLSLADLDQDSAGFILGKDSYKDPILRTGNLNPEAFRKATAIRLSSRWSLAPTTRGQIEFTPYLRTSDMEFLQHFQPGQPLEENGHDSAGLLFDWAAGDNWTMGADFEWADIFLTVFQEDPVTSGPPVLQETRPQGFHYDYSVRSLMLAGWIQYQNNIMDNLILTAGIRGESLDYDYDNHMLPGNTRDDGTECGFGGCLPTRPADRSDRFNNLAPEIGLNWAISDTTTLYTRLARGFRAPQATELYRLQRRPDSG